MDDNGHQRLDDTSCEHDDSTDSLPCIPTMCCCGNDDCAFQQQNNEAFASLDENLRKAGRLGKVSLVCLRACFQAALLVRHEAYVAEAEEQKALMDA
ncbi:hypothetical protein KCU68_g5353, partial [Aureobasidium melanogenum]